MCVVLIHWQVIEKMETILDAKLRERNQENPEKKKRKGGSLSQAE